MAWFTVTVNATDPDPTARLECAGPVKVVIRSAAERWGITGDGLSDLLTVAYELVVNAVRHSPPGRHQAALHLSPDGRRVMVEVYDHSHRMPRVPTQAFGDGQAESGRGLLVVAGLSTKWGANPTLSGKRIWAEVELPEPVQVPELSRAAHRARVITDAIAVSRMRAVPRPPRMRTEPRLRTA